VQVQQSTVELSALRSKFVEAMRLARGFKDRLAGQVRAEQIAPSTSL
jgi:hypothetical protein